jgi:hypothetical protein
VEPRLRRRARLLPRTPRPPGHPRPGRMTATTRNRLTRKELLRGCTSVPRLVKRMGAWAGGGGRRRGRRLSRAATPAVRAAGTAAISGCGLPSRRGSRGDGQRQRPRRGIQGIGRVRRHPDGRGTSAAGWCVDAVRRRWVADGVACSRWRAWPCAGWLRVGGAGLWVCLSEWVVSLDGGAGAGGC